MASGNEPPASGNIRRLGQFSCIAAAQSNGTETTSKQLSSLYTREEKGQKKLAGEIKESFLYSTLPAVP